ncbi:MAG: hypothetical protein Kow0099_15800 [Candidatus Abyssubacteria bacterium]
MFRLIPGCGKVSEISPNWGDTMTDAHEPRNWKVKKQDGSRLEPANLDVLRQWVASGQIAPDDMIINDDLADWIRAAEVLELFDLFEKGNEVVSRQRRAEAHTVKKREDDVEVPDCINHPGRPAETICVGCGKFICKECREQLEGKVYCRRCAAEKKAGVEPGAPVGPGAPRNLGHAEVAPSVSRLAIASLVFAVIAVLSSFVMVVPKYALASAPAIGLVAFIAVLLGGLALNRMRLGGGVQRGRQFALAGLVSGGVALAVSLAFIVLFADRTRSEERGQTAGLQNIVPGRHPRMQPPPPISKEAREEREANAKALLTEIERYLNEGDLEQAVSVSRTVMGLYPETQTAKIVSERFPALEQALADKKAQEEELMRQSEQLARQRLDHALQMYSEGNRVTALDLLKSIVESYPQTAAAEEARAEIAKMEQAIAEQQLRKLEEEAARLANKAEQLIQSEQYAEAVAVYRDIVSRYQHTPTAAAVKSKLREAELLASDPSEREFRSLKQSLESLTYEESISRLRDFLAKFPQSGRAAEAEALLNENQNHKNAADSLYNFGHAYFEEERYSVALGRYDKLIKEHPRSRWIPQAQKEYEQTLEKLQQ